MGMCGRCLFGETVRKYGAENVIEIKGESKIPGWVSYDIYVRERKLSHQPRHGNRIVFEDYSWTWVMTGYSNEHSYDEDCYYSRKVQETPEAGYPRKVDKDLVKKVQGI